MNISRGEEWGHTAPVPDGVTVLDGDRRVASALMAGLEVAVTGGDLAATIGCSRAPVSGEAGRRLPVDLVEVEIVRGGDRSRHVAVAHVMIRRPRLAGGRLWGEVCWIMNSQYFAGLDLVPRGHPNDGRVEVLSVDRSMGRRQRLLAWRRARTGHHLPHPSISIRTCRETVIRLPGHVVVVDGRRVGRSDEVVVRVLPDAAHLWV